MGLQVRTVAVVAKNSARSGSLQNSEGFCLWFKLPASLTLIPVENSTKKDPSSFTTLAVSLRRPLLVRPSNKPALREETSAESVYRIIKESKEVRIQR